MTTQKRTSGRTLTAKETELINLIAESENPEETLKTAILLCIYVKEQNPNPKTTTVEEIKELFLQWQKEKAQLYNEINRKGA